MHSAVSDNITGQAIEGVESDVGGRAPSGLEQQDARQGDYNLRTVLGQDGRKIQWLSAATIYPSYYTNQSSLMYIVEARQSWAIYYDFTTGATRITTKNIRSTPAPQL